MRTGPIAPRRAGDDAAFCLVFPREALSVPVMRRVLGDTLTRLGVDEESVADLLLAVTEACTNVLRHSGHGHRYEVVARVRGDTCVLQVLDGGRGLDPARAQALLSPATSPRPVRPGPAALYSRLARARRGAMDRIIAQLPESGRGMMIMRACVDDVTLRSRPGRGTVVSLQKRIEWRDDAPLNHPETIALRDVG